MKASQAVFNFLGIVAGLSAAFVMTSCHPEDDLENANTPPTESTGIPEEVADEVDAIGKRLEADMLSEAGIRVNATGKDAETFATQSTGIPEEVADEVDAIGKRLEAEMLSEAGIRVNAPGKDAEAFATQSTGIPEEVADEVDAIGKRLEAEMLSEAGMRVNAPGKDAEAVQLRAPKQRAVYAKVILPVRAPAADNQLGVESWIAQKLQELGATDLRSVTGWVRLPEEGDSTNIWEATLDGELSGCRVDGEVSERAAQGRLHVTLSGWSPFGAKVTGNTLPAEIGARSIAVVDPGRADGMKSYVALIVAPALETKTGEQDGADQPATASDSKPEGKEKAETESKRRSQ